MEKAPFAKGRKANVFSDGCDSTPTGRILPRALFFGPALPRVPSPCVRLFPCPAGSEGIRFCVGEAPPIQQVVDKVMHKFLCCNNPQIALVS
jgi:hypothetical protein